LRPTVWHRTTSASSVSELGDIDDKPAAEKPDVARRLIPHHDLDLVVNGTYLVCCKSHTQTILTRVAELMALHRGQGLDILWRDTLRCPTEDEYVEMVKDSRFLSLSKEPSCERSSSAETGGLLRITIKLLMACATTNTNM